MGESAPGLRLKMKGKGGPEAIPVRNVYYLLCYAWDQWVGGPPVEVETVEGASVLDLLALVLARGSSRLLKQGLRREYWRREEEIPAVRGKLLLAPSVSRGLLKRARTMSAFDELSEDTPANRIIKSTLRELLLVDGLSREVRAEVKEPSTRFPRAVQVGPVRLRDIARIPVHRNNRTYGLLLEVCRLIHANLLVSQTGRGSTFQDPRHDERQMWRIFEGFLRRFLAREQDRYDVAATALQWHGAKGTPHDKARLPGMQTDVVLSARHRVLVLDAKFYLNAFSGRFGQEGVRPGHLYQILAYLKNLAAAERVAAAGRGSPPRPVEGVLVYPVVEEGFDLQYELLGHRIRICSVDLSREWTGVHDEVLGVVEWG